MLDQHRGGALPEPPRRQRQGGTHRLRHTLAHQFLLCLTRELLAEAKEEFDRFTSQDATFIFVTNEIGSGGVSDNALQRRFTDLQGWMNQYIASRADTVVLMVSGIPVNIKSRL